MIFVYVEKSYKWQLFVVSMNALSYYLLYERYLTLELI